MRRSDAFWGAGLVTAGIVLLISPSIVPAEWLDRIAPLALGLGILTLGVSIVMARKWLQTLAAIIAGVCLGAVVAYMFRDINSAQSRLLEFSCHSHLNDESDTTSSDDTLTLLPDTTMKQQRLDTIPAKPIY